MAHHLHNHLYPVVRQHAPWFVCAHELSVLLPELGARATAAFHRYAADQSCYPTELMPLARAFYLLAGYAAENFVKGSWLRAHPEPPPSTATDTEPFVPPDLTVHSLAQLSREAGIPLSAEDHDTLTFLEQCVTWYARYPFPKNAGRFSLFGVDPAQVTRVQNLIATLSRHAFPTAAA